LLSLRLSSIVTVLALFVINAGQGPTAQAAPTADIVLSRKVGPPGTMTRTYGSGFAPGELVGVSLDEESLRRIFADEMGSFTLNLRIPRGIFPGEHLITATGVDSGQSAQATFTVRTDWPMYRFNAGRTGFNRYENILSTENVAGLEVAWTADTRTPIIGSAPAVVDGVVYISSSAVQMGTPRVNAFDAATGEFIWASEEMESVAGSSPAVAYGHVYVVGDARLYALDQETGALLWSRDTGSGIGEDPAVLDGVVYVAGEEVHAFDALTGEEIWAADTGASAGSALAVADGVVVASNVTGVYALDAATGEQLWVAHPPLNPTRTPAVSGGRVFIGTSGGGEATMCAIDAKTGEFLWITDLPDGDSTGPVVGHGLVLFASTNTYALDTETGKTVWSATIAEEGVVSSIGMAGRLLFFGSFDDHLYAVNALTGAELWQYGTESNVTSSPAVVDGSVYVGSEVLYAFRLP
jgi:outer membrane protein assembly factor BamB